jgi:hypothetical protein
LDKQVYYFLIDYLNQANYYRLGIFGQDRDAIYKYLCLFSKDVRYLDSKPLSKRDKGLRKLPNNLGIIVNCTYYLDKARNNSKISDYKIKSIEKTDLDKRHTRIDVNG